MIRKHFRFTGRVQGVGFRYRAKHAAERMGVTGWVKNEYDGSVELEAQGQEESINRMLVMINNSEYIMITSMDEKPIPVREDERSFRIL